MREHFQLILDGLDIGLDGVTEVNDAFKSVLTELPTLLASMPPPIAVRAIVTIDGTPYEVVIRAATDHPSFARDKPYPEEPECPRSTHGKHTPIDGVCIGCGEKVS